MSCSSDIKEEFIDEKICRYLVSNNLSILLKCLAQSAEYLKSKASLQSRKSDKHFDYLCDFFPTIVETIFHLTPIPGNDKIGSHLNTMIPHFYDFKRLKTLESADLKTLIKTSNKVKNLILTNQDIAVLAKPELVVEAFRLSAFMRKDLLENPDDINEIALKIGQLKKESRRLILRILDTIRKKSLKEAESNPKTRFQIRKLAAILQRKKKTYSFVQLKDQIEYERLLTFFPCWIMSIEDAARIFPLQEGLFDYLIVDEASQCNQATALHLAYRAKRMIVVGDSKQMKNPNTQFLSDQVVRLYLTKYGLDNHPKAEFFHGKKSLLDLAGGCSDRSDVFLNEHFRCEPPLIAFSNNHFYDRKLKILTPFRRRRFSPCMEIKTINGAYDDPDNTKQNEIEAAAVIAELKRMIAQGELEGDEKGEKLSVGLLSPFRHQATLLQSKMYEAFEDDPSKIKEYDMIASTVDGFQGDERDVILYSFRYALNSKPGSITAMQRENDEHSLGRINVAFSRPKRKSVCFISTPKENFPKGLIRDYLNHAAIENSRPSERMGNSNEREKCQSDFEKNVFDDLVKEGLDVFGQVPCAGFFIDFVVIDRDGRRMALECDGDFHYEEDGDLREEDYQRQDIIERYGWLVYRIPVRRYYADPRMTIEHLLSALRQQNPDEEVGGGFNGPNGDGSNGPTGYSEEPESIEDKVSLNKESKTTETIEDKIIGLLSEEGPMTTWMIAGKIRQSREETHLIMKSLEEKKWVIAIKEKGVLMWKEIL